MHFYLRFLLDTSAFTLQKNSSMRTWILIQMHTSFLLLSQNNTDLSVHRSVLLLTICLCSTPGSRDEWSRNWLYSSWPLFFQIQYLLSQSSDRFYEKTSKAFKNWKQLKPKTQTNRILNKIWDFKSLLSFPICQNGLFSFLKEFSRGQKKLSVRS